MVGPEPGTFHMPNMYSCHLATPLPLRCSDTADNTKRKISLMIVVKSKWMHVILPFPYKPWLEMQGYPQHSLARKLGAWLTYSKKWWHWTGQEEKWPLKSRGRKTYHFSWPHLTRRLRSRLERFVSPLWILESHLKRRKWRGVLFKEDSSERDPLQSSED